MQEITEKNSRIWSRLGQRGTICGKALFEILNEDKNAIVLTADLSILSGLERIKKSFPDQFINVGIAEQNLIGVASGMAFRGDTVFATTYATFISMRCYEQIRHNLGYQFANVKIIGSAAGFAMGMSGNTHYTYEDIAIMRAIPNITVMCPADSSEAYVMIHKAAEVSGPMYIRLTGNLNTPIVYNAPFDFVIGKGNTIKNGDDISIIATGTMVAEALSAAEKLERIGVGATVIDMHTIKPIDKALVKKQYDKKLIITVEEHSILGGLGGGVAEILSESWNAPELLRIGIEDRFLRPSNYERLLRDNDLTSDGIFERIVEKIKNGRSCYS